MEIKNAILSSNDHGVLSAWITLDYGGSGQCFGGHCLYSPHQHKNKEPSANYAGHFIWRVMEVVGVAEWSKLKGETLRVRVGHGGIEAIGNIITDDWFCPRNEFQEMEELLKQQTGF